MGPSEKQEGVATTGVLGDGPRLAFNERTRTWGTQLTSKIAETQGREQDSAGVSLSLNEQRSARNVPKPLANP